MLQLAGGDAEGSVPDTLEALIERARRGDSEALGSLLNHFRMILHASVCQQGWSSGLRPRVGESDVVAETLLKAYRDFPKFEGTSVAEFRKWLLQILTHTAINFANQHSAALRDRRRDVASKEGAVLLPNSEESPSALLMRQEKLEQLKQALSWLNENEGSVLRLRYLEDFDFKDIADRLSLSLENVYKLHQRGLQALQDLLSDEHDNGTS